MAPKVLLCTGGHSGIGAATTRLFAKQGWAVLSCDINVTDQFAALPNVESLKLDVTDEEAVAAAVAHCVKKWGSLDCAFANAGISGGIAVFTECDEDEFTQVLKVNVLGVFFLLKHAALAMQKLNKGGSLISTASVAGLRSGAGSTAYSASKAAVVNMTQTVANQLAGTNIRCNCIAPGVIETGMTKPLFDMADANNSRKRIGQLNAMRRYAQPEEVAAVAYFLGNEASSYVNGVTIPVDGGLSSSHPVVPRKPGKAAM